MFCLKLPLVIVVNNLHNEGPRWDIGVLFEVLRKYSVIFYGWICFFTHLTLFFEKNIYLCT